jgi:hypothetical protein
MLGLVFVLGLAAPAAAQDASTQASPPAAQPAPSEQHIKAAMELLDATNTMGNMTLLFDAMWGQEALEIKREHHDVDETVMSQIQKIFHNAFLARQDEYKRLVAVLYAEHFSEDDLNALAAFYRSDVGKRYIATVPALIKEAAPVGAAWAQSVIADIREKIRDVVTRPKDPV